jgi:hypothetical protein
VTVWCAIGKVGVIGPYFFFEENGITTTVNSARYIDTINNFMEPELRSRRINNQNVWFQQDGATAHTARAAMAVVRAMFHGLLGRPTFQCTIFFCGHSRRLWVASGATAPGPALQALGRPYEFVKLFLR